MAWLACVLSLCISLPTLVTVVAVNCCWWLCATAISWKYSCATGDAKCHHHRQAIDNRPRPKFYRNYFSQLDEVLMSIAVRLGDKCQAINSHKPICPSIYAIRSKSIRRKWIYERDGFVERWKRGAKLWVVHSRTFRWMNSKVFLLRKNNNFQSKRKTIANSQHTHSHTLGNGGDGDDGVTDQQFWQNYFN